MSSPPPDPDDPAAAALIDTEILNTDLIARLGPGTFPRLVQEPRLFYALDDDTGMAKLYRVQSGGGTRLPRVIGSVPPPQRLIRIGASDYAADQILVKFKRTTSNQTIQNLLASQGLQVLAYAASIDWFVLSVPANVDVRNLVQALNRNPNVQLAELNGIVTGGATPVDQYYATQQWPLWSSKLKMEAAWGRTLGNSNFLIAVLDSGIKSNHEDLNPKIARDANGNLLGFNRVTTGYPEDDHGHGTFVSGIAAAQTTFPPITSGVGIAGVSPNSPILPVKVLNQNNAGTSAWLACGILDAITVPGVKVINASLRGYLPAEPVAPPCKMVLDAIKDANDNGVLFVSIMGNSFQGDAGFVYPGAYWRAMAVSATDINDNRASYSVTGPHNSVAAPGGDFSTGLIFSTLRLSPFYGNFDRGTSYAAPHVAGLATLVLSQFPGMTWWDLKYRIEDTADDVNAASLPGWDNELGWGRVSGDAATLPQSLATYDFPQDSKYRLVSLPVWASNLHPTDKSSDPARLFPNANATVLWWDPVGQRYRQYPSSMVPRIGAGRGYWVKFPQDPPATTYTGAYAFVKPDHPVVVHLLPGWNLIGTPARNNITWNRQTIKVRYYDTNSSSSTFGQATVKTLADASTGANRWTEGYAWRFNPATRQHQLVFDTTLVPSAIGQITPTEGYWFYAYVECELLLPSS